jgi:hypothetical protein
LSATVRTRCLFAEIKRRRRFRFCHQDNHDPNCTWLRVTVRVTLRLRIARVTGYVTVRPPYRGRNHVTNRTRRNDIEMRDPWWLIAALLCVLIGVWLGIFGELQQGFSAWIFKWQTLIGVFVATGAASVAVWNTTRSVKAAERLEQQRRNSKQSAVRSLLPIALSEIVDYSEKSAKGLLELVGKCSHQQLPYRTAEDRHRQDLPTRALDILSEFLEYTDGENLRLIEQTIGLIQIHNSRVRGIIKGNNDPGEIEVFTSEGIRSHIIDAASIAAGASAYFLYARRRSTALPSVTTWESVTDALKGMQMYGHANRELYQSIGRRMEISSGPFDHLLEH